MQPVLTTAQSRAFDKYLIEEIGIPSLVLMENAARAALDAIRDWLHSDPEVVIFAGPGNNGADGLAIARLLLERGIQPTVLLAADPEKLSPDARQQYDILSKLLDPEEIYS
ncbi:MAG TPA: NAD(P)H-hydrate epimerase, partial [Candidatus Kapabacteria bacterium]|nr:NAD(P)H-hydrate epimerase [Candidatus Kapabacteria bacterium]